MRAATEDGWELAAHVNFIYMPEEDSNCTPYNNNVRFDVRSVNSQPYLARAFFPHQSRRSSNVLITGSAFYSYWGLSGLLTHELGHVLGFRHEHTRPEAGQCYEDAQWEALTDYDSTSVMHYPHCGGTASNLEISEQDRRGANSLYGAPQGEPVDEPSQEEEIEYRDFTGSASGSLNKNEERQFKRIDVEPGSRFLATMSGSGDADLYLRFDQAPTTSTFHCRPYLDGSSEECAIDVPLTNTGVYIMVLGYTAADFRIDVTWRGPNY